MSVLQLIIVFLIVILIGFIVFGSTTPQPPSPSRATQKLPPSLPSLSPLGQKAPNNQNNESERCMDREMLKSFYPPPLMETVPLDYPRKAIGACPYSKPQSTSLPMADQPMYMA